MAQVAFKPSTSYKWLSDSSISIKTQGTNFNTAYLVNLKIYSEELKKKSILYKKDSVLIGKGIYQSKQKVFLSKEILNQFDSSLNIWIEYESVINNKLLASKKLILVKPIKKLPSLSFSDTSLNFRYSGKAILSLKITSFSDSHSAIILEEEKVLLQKDTGINSWELIHENPLKARVFIVEISNRKELLLIDTIHYENGIFKLNKSPNDLETKSDKETKQKAIAITGEVYIENNAFSNTPEHSNGLQYPNTIFRLSNTVTIYGIPFRLNAHHITNNNISPNFRNFFSFSLDVNSYRNQLREQLMAEDLTNVYSISEINKDLELNQSSINHLTQLKSTLLKYPNEKIELDSLLQKDVQQLVKSELKDTSNYTILTDSLNRRTDSISVDSNLNASKINKINQYIDRLESSNHYKEQLKNKKIASPINIDRSEFNGTNLYQKAQEQGLSTLFLRFEKLEIGNFYQYAGKYSIRDVEVIGFNAEFLLNPTNKIGFLKGKINKFQAFNLDELESNIQVTSVGLSNSNWKSFSPSIRVTQYDDKSINIENGGAAPQNYVTSIGVIGEVSGFLFYEGEINRSHSNWATTVSEQDDFLRNTAIYGKIEVTPFSFLDINLKYDRVGSNYQSDGVYFLLRDMQSYSIGSYLRLFNNKIYFKNDFTLITRNEEQKELLNESKKLFFDLGSRFKRIPNFQIVHAPISVDIANKLDTSFANLNAYSSVTIARVFYVKKIKKTIYNTALIYSEILNDYFEGTDKQRGFQHFIGISNEFTQFSFTSSYTDIFEKIRFVSTNVSHQINNWCRGSLYFAKNFQDDRYSEIARLKFDLKVGKSLILGVGGAALFERKQTPNYGSTISLKYVY